MRTRTPSLRSFERCSAASSTYNCLLHESTQKIRIKMIYAPVFCYSLILARAVFFPVSHSLMSHFREPRQSSTRQTNHYNYKVTWIYSNHPDLSSLITHLVKYSNLLLNVHHYFVIIYMDGTLTTCMICGDYCI